MVTNAEEPPTPDEQPTDTVRPPRPARWKLSLVIAGIVIIQVANLIANFTLPFLIAKHPMWLVFMQPTTKNLLAIAAKLPFELFFITAVLRRQVPHILWWYIGRWYGDAGIAWIKKRSPDIGRMIEMLERKFPKYGWLICLLYPHPVVCAMAGASAMRFLPFLIYTYIGIMAFVWAAWAGSDLLSPVIDPIIRFTTDYFIPLTVVTVVLTAIMFWQSNRTGENKIDSIHRIEEELDHELDQKLEKVVDERLHEGLEEERYVDDSANAETDKHES